MKVELMTILPGVLHSYLLEGMVGRAIREGLLEVNVHNVRHYADNKHKTTDDSPYGGGPGQVMTAQPLASAVGSLPQIKSSRSIFLSPQGRPLTGNIARQLSRYRRLVLVCGRYEGVDQRFIDKYVDEEISIGDYVLTGGELPALVLLDAVARFVPGVLGNEQSAESDSFCDGLLEHPQYTKPATFEDMEVPKVLLSGNHRKIEDWRRQKAIEKTASIRPDLYEIWRKSQEELEKKMNDRRKGHKK